MCWGLDQYLLSFKHSLTIDDDLALNITHWNFADVLLLHDF
jgi:hypothetical protein